MKYPIPSRVPLPTMRPDPQMMPAQPRMMASQFPPAPMAPAAQPQRRGIMGMASENPEMFLALGAGLLGGRTGREQWAGGLSGMAQAMGTAREKKEAKAKENATLEWLKSNAPEYADAVAQGVLTAGDAYKMTLEAKKPKNVDLPNAYQEWMLAKQDGYEGSFAEWKKSSNPGTTINMGGGKFDEEFAKQDAQSLSEIYNSGLQAQRNISRIDQLESLLETAPTGTEGAIKMAAGQLGIRTEGLDDIQAAQALINSLVPEQRQPGSGPMSDADLALFKESLPRIINQPGGNKKIVQTMRAIAQYDAQGAAIIQELRSGGISRSEAFQMLQSRANPLAGVRDMAGAARPAPSPGASDIDSLVDKWGN